MHVVVLVLVQFVRVHSTILSNGVPSTKYFFRKIVRTGSICYPSSSSSSELHGF